MSFPLCRTKTSRSAEPTALGMGSRVFRVGWEGWWWWTTSIYNLDSWTCESPRWEKWQHTLDTDSAGQMDGPVKTKAALFHVLLRRQPLERTAQILRGSSDFKWPRLRIGCLSSNDPIKKILHNVPSFLEKLSWYSARNITPTDYQSQCWKCHTCQERHHPATNPATHNSLANTLGK